MPGLRLFVSVGLPSEVRAYLARLVERMATRVQGGAVKWVPEKNMHLTLRFLGETDPKLVPGLATALDQVAVKGNWFALQLEALGCFPNPRRPRVIWAGLAGDLAELRELQASLEQSLVPLGWQPERRPFHPHITLGRVKDERSVARAELPWGEKLERLSCPVEALHLMESKLSPSGAEYYRQHSSPLTRPRDGA